MEFIKNTTKLNGLEDKTMTILACLKDSTYQEIKELVLLLC